MIEGGKLSAITVQTDTVTPSPATWCRVCAKASGYRPDVPKRYAGDSTGCAFPILGGLFVTASFFVAGLMLKAMRITFALAKAVRGDF